MADNENIFDDDISGGQEMEVGQKVGLLPSMLLKILKILALVVALVLLVSTITVITVNLLGVGSQATSYMAPSPEYEGRAPLLAYFNAIDEIRTNTNDDNPATASLKIVLGYNERYRGLLNELTARLPQLKDLTRRYFSTKTAQQFNDVEYESVMKLELMELINQQLSNGRIEMILFLEKNTFGGF